MIRCVCLAYRMTDGEAYRLGAHQSPSEWGAMLWVGLRAAHFADQLDDPARGAIRTWLADQGQIREALERLRAGENYFLLIDDRTVHYLLSVTPSTLDLKSP